MHEPFVVAPLPFKYSLELQRGWLLQLKPFDVPPHAPTRYCTALSPHEVWEQVLQTELDVPKHPPLLKVPPEQL